MRHSCLFVLALGALGAGIASPQSISPDLTKYLTLTDTEVQSINALNTAFNQYANAQQNQYFKLQSQALAELGKDSPVPSVVGGLYAQMEMMSRDYNTQLAQLQSKVAAVLTTGQVVLASALLDVVRLQPLVSEAQCVNMESPIVFTGSFTFTPIPVATPVTGVSPILQYAPVQSTPCSPTPLPTALVNYLNLSDSQQSTIENAIQGNQEYLTRQALKIQELQYEIQDLTAAQTIDTVSLGADYVAIAQLQRDETTQSGQLGTTVRSVLADQQQPQLKALDNAVAMNGTASAAVSSNILVLPPDLKQSYGVCGLFGSFLNNVVPNPFSGTTCGGVSFGVLTRPATVY